jgi:hypothetical protein
MRMLLLGALLTSLACGAGTDDVGGGGASTGPGQGGACVDAGAP